MEHGLAGHWPLLGVVALKALLLYVVAILGLRLSSRRTLAQLSIFDFVVAVAAGAIVGRTPGADATSFAEGAVTLAVLVAAHRVLGRLRMLDPVAAAIDYSPLFLVRDGEAQPAALSAAHLRRDDLTAILRANGVEDIGDVHHVIFESGGAISVIRRAAA